MSIEAGLSADFVDLLDALTRHDVEYLVVGAHALAAHGIVRATGDLDVWVKPSATNAVKVMAALLDFGAPVSAHGLLQSDFEREGTVYQMGLPPTRIDVLTQISGVTFDEAWPDRVVELINLFEVSFLGRSQLITNKRAAGRDKDLLDVKRLEEKPQK